MKLNYNGPEKYEDKKYDCYKCEDRHEDKKYEDKCEYHQPCCEEHKYAKCYPKSPCAYGILFECNNGTGTEIPPTFYNGTSLQFPKRSLGCVSIDTSCLKMPTVKFDFSTLIEYTAIGAVGVRVTFELVKVCDNRSDEIPCATWDWIAVLAAGERITTSFCFNYCECAACPGCCTYYVRISDAQNVSADHIKIYNPSLSVIAKSSC
jgi:Domain of unknown function (DUF4489)